MLTTHTTVSSLTKQISGDILLLANLQTSVRFHQLLYQYPFSDPRIVQSVTVSHLLCLSQPWHFGRVPIRYFVKHSPHFSLSDVFSWLNLGDTVSAIIQRKWYMWWPVFRWVLSMGAWFHYVFFLALLTLITWLKWGLPGLFTVKLLLFPLVINKYINII